MSMQSSIQRLKINNYIVFDNNVLYEIFRYANRKQILVFRLISKQWNNIALMYIKTLKKSPNTNNILKIFKHLTLLKLDWNNTITDNGLTHLKNITHLNY